MSGPLRLEYQGAVYHVTSRGNERPGPRVLPFRLGISGERIQRPVSRVLVMDNRCDREESDLKE
jgi:hypothetical protein